MQLPEGLASTAPRRRGTAIDDSFEAPFPEVQRMIGKVIFAVSAQVRTPLERSTVLRVEWLQEAQAR